MSGCVLLGHGSAAWWVELGQCLSPGGKIPALEWERPIPALLLGKRCPRGATANLPDGHPVPHRVSQRREGDRAAGGAASARLRGTEWGRAGALLVLCLRPAPRALPSVGAAPSPAALGCGKPGDSNAQA